MIMYMGGMGVSEVRATGSDNDLQYTGEAPVPTIYLNSPDPNAAPSFSLTAETFSKPVVLGLSIKDLLLIALVVYFATRKGK